MTNRHHITDEQLGKEIGYLISNRVEYVTFPAATYLAIQDRLGEQDKNWSPSRLIERLVPGAWRLPVVAGRIAKITAGVVVALLIATVLIWQGRDSDQGVQPAADLTPTPIVADDSDVMNPDNRFDLSGMNASATEAEIIRLLNDGHVMYTRQKVMRKAFFEPGGVFMSAPGCTDFMRSIPKIVCEGYPETVIEEWWESVDSSGTVKAYFGRLTTLDDVLLATGIQGEWIDAGSGEKWSAGRREGRKLVRDVGTTFAIIEEKETENLVGTESEFAGRPSLIFLVADEYAGRPGVSFDDGESEYQVANPFFQRVAYWFDDEDGTRTMRSEITVLDFALLPSGSLPKFAVLPELAQPNVPNLSEQLDLEGMDAATIQAEFTRLLAEGHVLYLRMERFGLGGAYNGLCGPAFGASMPQPVCDDYPGRIVRETWESTDLSGVVQISYGRESKLDGTVLAIKIQGTWTDVASGGTWTDGRREDFNLIESIEVGFTIIEREYERGLDGVESEYLGNPSIIFADTFEYQIVNPMLWRQVRMQELGDGMQTILSEARFTGVAILPPGSFPDFAVPAVVAPSVPATASPTPGLTASFTVHDLDIEPKVGTVFETLLSKLPDNQATRGYTRLGDPAGVIDALGGETLAPGSSTEDATQFIQTLMEIDLYNGMFIPLYEWPSEQRDYAGSIDTYPDLAFDWASVEQFAQSGGSFPGISFTSGSGQPTLYDVALGKFDADTQRLQH